MLISGFSCVRERAAPDLDVFLLKRPILTAPKAAGPTRFLFFNQAGISGNATSASSRIVDEKPAPVRFGVHRNLLIFLTLTLTRVVVVAPALLLMRCLPAG
jgi:hypothetical protein